jgi:HK97 gp10 family phage protein
MPTINVKIKNLSQIKSAFKQSPRLMAQELTIAIEKSIFTIKRDSMLNTPVLTGRLRASTYTTMGYLQGAVGTNTNYDVYVHEGTKYMASRPYLRNAVESNDKNIQKFFTEAVDKVLNKIGSMT